MSEMNEDSPVVISEETVLSKFEGEPLPENEIERIRIVDGVIVEVMKIENGIVVETVNSDNE